MKYLLEGFLLRRFMVIMTVISILEQPPDFVNESEVVAGVYEFITEVNHKIFNTMV